MSLILEWLVYSNIPSGIVMPNMNSMCHTRISTTTFFRLNLSAITTDQKVSTQLHPVSRALPSQ